MAIANQNVEMYQGEIQQIAFAITDSVGDPLDITSMALEWVLAGYNEAVLLTKTNPLGIVITDGGGGLGYINLQKADTASLGPGAYYHELRDTTDEVVVLSGVFTLVWSSTK